MKHKVLAALGAVISVIGISAASAAPALARPLEHDHFDEGTSAIAQEEFPGFCDTIVDFPVLHEHNAQGMFLFVLHGDGLAYGGGPARSTDVWTNTLNEQTFTITAAGQQRDLKVTDNGDGTLTIEGMLAGVQKAYGPDGTLLFIDSGTVRFEFLVDHSGTPSDPTDDEFIRDLGVTAMHGRVDTAGRDFCQDLVTIIG
jgi:hypothetical protein